MVEGDSARHPRVIVVDGPRDDLVAPALRLTSEYDVEITRCDDIYSAVAELAAPGKSGILLVGQLRDMARENGRLFALAERNQARCCCVVEPNRPAAEADMVAAIRGRVSLVVRPEEIERVVREWLAWSGCRGRSTACNLADDEFRATEAELRALLERDVDE